MSPDERKRHALLAATQASHAVAALLEQGACGESDTELAISYGDETACLLLDAAKLTIETIQSESEEFARDDELNQVLGAIAKYIEGWAG